MIGVDLRDFFNEVRLITVVRQWMVAVGDVDLAVRARSAFVRDQKCNHAGEVGLKGHRHHVRHQLEVLGEICRYAVRLFHVRIDLRVVLLGSFRSGARFHG